MKKKLLGILTIVVIPALLFTFYIYYNISRKNVIHTYIIEDFDQVIYDTLQPKTDKYGEYYVNYINIRGYVNDTIIVCNNTHKNCKGYRFTGEINTNLPDDYFGTNIRTMKFDPYKATDGKIKIIHGIK